MLLRWEGRHSCCIGCWLGLAGGRHRVLIVLQFFTGSAGKDWDPASLPFVASVASLSETSWTIVPSAAAMLQSCPLAFWVFGLLLYLYVTSDGVLAEVGVQEGHALLSW